LIEIDCIFLTHLCSTNYPYVEITPAIYGIGFTLPKSMEYLKRSTKLEIEKQ